MPFTTGTARTPSELLAAMNAHLTANGWTRLRGDPDLACASPKAARYWRLNIQQSQTATNNFKGLRVLQFRTTVGGANVATNAANFSSNLALSAGTFTNLLTSGNTTNVRGTNINSYYPPWIITYDFGSPTTIREVVIRTEGTTLGASPSHFAIQWSNDGLTWTTMRQVVGEVWTLNQEKVFTFNDGFLDSEHVASNAPRRSGRAESVLDSSSAWGTSASRAFSEDYFAWQAPGYDANRRVFIHARGYTFPGADTHVISFDFSVNYDGAILNWQGQAGSSGGESSHLMNSAEITYWFYSNSKRFILVTRQGAQDYTSTYAGFGSAFATPDDYPFPLLIASTMGAFNAYNYSQSNNRMSFCADPGSGGGARARLWDGTIIQPMNRGDVDGSGNRYLGTPTNAWVWPFHFGSTDNGTWPYDFGGDSVDNNAPHGFEFVAGTAQGALPLIPCTVQHDPFGNIMTMDGVFAIPSGGLLTPTQLITIGGQNYRIFPNRTRREQANWMAIRED